MRNILLSILLLSLISLTGCVKEALLSTRLHGDWIIDRTYTTIVPANDFSFSDIYTLPWSGTVNVNGVTLTNCKNEYSSWNDVFVVNPEIYVSIFGNNLYYKNKQYPATIYKSKFNNGEFRVECSFVHDNSSFTIQIDMKAQVVQLKKDNRYEFNLGDDPAGVPLKEISFNFFHKTNGTVRYDDIIDNFNGSWDLSIGQLFLAFKSDIFNAKHLQTYRYSFGNDRMYLTNPVKYSKYAFYGTIPEENIKDITYTNVFKRK